MFHFIEEADLNTEVLLVHAPYPGRLMFRAPPSSLLAAIGPFVVRNGTRNVGLLDPVSASEEFYADLKTILRDGSVKAVCISTSTAAIEETARIALLAQSHAPEALVVVGGPHEDDIDVPVAHRLEGVHVSIAGDGEFALSALLEHSLQDNSPIEELEPDLVFATMQCASAGRFTTSYSGGESLTVDRGPIPEYWRRPHALTRSLPTFAPFNHRPTIPFMVSRGCPYGKCTFCAEANRGPGSVTASSFDWIEALAEEFPAAALYSQDSIFPRGRAVNEQLLPTLKRLARPWGAQVYLGALPADQLVDMASHGCTYVYTGIESANADLLGAAGKPALSDTKILDRLEWCNTQGLATGLSVMFGILGQRGETLETLQTLDATQQLLAQAKARSKVVGTYFNVLTLLPGTQLAQRIARHIGPVNFYRIPRTPQLEHLEDGGVGYNFTNITHSGAATERDRLLAAISRSTQPRSRLST